MSNERQDENAVSGLYKELPKEQPSAATDKAIMDYARHRVSSKNKPKPLFSQHYRWLSVAASITLVSVIFLSQWQNFTPEGLQEPTESEVLIPAVPNEKAEAQQSTSEQVPKAKLSAMQDTLAKPESASRVQVASRKMQVQGLSVKAECEFSVDGANPLSRSTLGKYISDLNYQAKNALAVAINNQSSIEDLVTNTPALQAIIAKPGFSEHYRKLSDQVQQCHATTGPADR